MNLGWGTRDPAVIPHYRKPKWHAHSARFSSQINVDRAARMHTKSASHCACPNWHNTKMNVNQSLLGKGRILIISHYSGMPCQLAEPNPGTFSSSLHPWDAVRWKERDPLGFRIHSDLQFTPVLPDVLWAPSLHKPGTRACKPEGKQGRGGRWTAAAGMEIFKIGAESQSLRI